MTTESTNTESETSTHAAYHPTLPIQFVTGLNPRCIAREINRTYKWLLNLTEQAIRKRHREAFIEHECHKTHEPHILCLPLCRYKSMLVFFTIEPQAIVVRGYHWDIDREPLDDCDGGFIVWSTIPKSCMDLDGRSS